MKRVLSLALALILTVGTAAVAFAADTAGTYSLGVSGDSGSTGSHAADDVRPGDELLYYIYLDGRPVDRSTIRTDKIDVKLKASEGSRAYEEVALKYDGNGYAYVKLEFIDPYVSTKELDFHFTIYLTANKTRMTETEFDIIGTLENDEQFVDENDDYVNLSDCPVVEAEGYVKAIEAELGDGLSIFTKMFEGKRYYGYVTQEITAADDEIISKYPAIDTVYNLQTVNLNSSGNYAVFDVDTKMYVYNADLEYIGTTADKLPYSTKYYLASVELDVDASAIDTIPEYSETENVPGGGDDVPSNVNENPGTGR